MTDSEILLLDAEFWGSYEASSEVMKKLAHETQVFIPRIAFLENFYGMWLDADGLWINVPADLNTRDNRQQRCFFALLMAASESE